MQDDNPSPANALTNVIAILSALDEQERQRVLSAVRTFFGIEPDDKLSRTAQKPIRPDFSDDYSPTPKEFMLQKQPRTDVERIACLAYYLAHFRDMPHFKTLDLAKLNTEAAQPKFSNAAYSAKNALNQGYLAPATKGQRQLSAAAPIGIE
jgi:hypothetical protein